MSDTMWFNRSAGDVVARGTTDPCSNFIGAPDYVLLPHNLGGANARVVEVVSMACPVCASGHVVRHLILDVDVAVAECGKMGFLWYRHERI